MGISTKRKPKLWKLLPLEDKKGVVRTLLNAKYTREAIGKALGTSKNAIVGFQHNHLPMLTGKTAGTIEVVPYEVLRALVSSEWPLEKGDEAEKTADARAEQSVEESLQIAHARRPKLAASEATQCEFVDPGDNRRCGFEWIDAITHRCNKHQKLR